MTLEEVHSWSASCQDGSQNSGNCFVNSKQNSSTENESTESHRGPSPKSADTSIGHDAPHGDHGACPCRGLGSRLDGVEWLGGICRYDPSHSSIGKIGDGSVLSDPALFLEIFQNVVRAKTKGCRTGLFKRGPCVASVETSYATFLPNDTNGMRERFEAFVGPSIIDECGFHALSRGHGKSRSDDPRRHSC